LGLANKTEMQSIVVSVFFIFFMFYVLIFGIWNFKIDFFISNFWNLGFKRLEFKKEPFFTLFPFLEFGIKENLNLNSFLKLFLGFLDNCVNNLSALSRILMGI